MSEQHENDLREAMERLNEQNRILQEARMLPANKPLTADQTHAVIERFNQYIEQRKIKPAQVARQIDYSEGVISEWRRNVYKGDFDAVTRALNDWMERDSRRAEAARPKDEVKTWVAETIRTIAHQADKRLMMAAIVAPAGSGKTKVLQALTDEMRGIYLSIDSTMNRRGLLRSLSMALGRKAEFGSMNLLMRFIVTELKGTRRIIFIDEAHQLGQAIGLIRSIHDQAGVPIVMAGTADILRLVDDRVDGRGQFSSRTMICNLIDDVVNAEAPEGGTAGRDLFTLEEIKAFFATRKIRLADDAMRLLWLLACLPNHGTLRLVGTLADVAADLNGGADLVTRNDVLGAMQLLVGGVRARHLKAMADRQGEQRKQARVA